jgi:hypothetical protein
MWDRRSPCISSRTSRIARLGEPDHYAVGVFSCTTLIQNTAGQIVDGDISVAIV